ncbi:MAG TPA: PAS domain S-box protein, partial [Ferruginibacter sp.]|nr:PAS domain S-box protein [Ferruginibacter sp.]
MKKMRLLILEDSPDDAAFMEVTLKRAGLDLNIKIVSSRPEYIKALDSFVPEFILSDHQLPDFISTEALAIARKKYPGVPFILVTGTVSEEFAVEILKAGADDYMLKDRMSRLPLAMEMALKKRKALKELSDYKYALDEFAIVAITDQKGIITYANQNFCKISKYDPEELIGQDHRIINSGIHPASYIKELWVTIANGKIWHGEFCNRAKDGSLYWVDTSIIPFLDAQGKPYQYLSIRMDITERKKIQEQLFEREEQLELFIKHSPAALAMLDNEMRYIALSERWIRDYKLDNIELAGASHYGIFPGLPQRWKDIHKRCLAGAIEKSEEDYMINADGSKSWLRWEVHPWRKAWGEIGGIIIFSEDITERKKAVEEILQIQMRLKQAQEIAHLGNWAVNFTNNTSYWSDEAYQIYGVEPGNHNFSIEDWLSFVHPDDLHFVKQKIEESMATYSDYGFDHRIIRKDGSVRHIYSESKFEFNLNGEPVGLYGIAHDITQSKKDEEELKKSERRLKEAQSVAHLGNWEIDLVRNTHT